MNSIYTNTNSPIFAPGMICWYESDDVLSNGSYGGSGAQQYWYDKSTNQILQSQSTGANRPTLNNNVVAGLPAMTFTASSSTNMAANKVISLSNYTFIIALNFSGFLSNDQIPFMYGNPSSSGFYLWYQRSTNKIVAGNIGGTNINLSTPATGWQIISATLNGTTFNGYVNGSLVVTASSGLTPPATDFYIGQYQGNDYFNSNIYGLLIYNNAVSAANFTNVHRYFGNKLGISVP